MVEDEKPKEDNRITFGVNSGDSNSLNYSISNPSGTFSSAYRNPTSPTTNSNSNNYNYYKSHTLNYHTINNEPYNSNNKVQITAKTEQNATGKIEQTNIYKPEQIISSNTINSAQKQTE